MALLLLQLPELRWKLFAFAIRPYGLGVMALPFQRHLLLAGFRRRYLCGGSDRGGCGKGMGVGE